VQDLTASSTHPEQLLAAASQLAKEAGQRILPFYQKTCTQQLKADRSPLTEADLASHGFLVKALTELTPRWPVVSEESSEVELPDPAPDDFWLVDPLDGTKEFLKGKPEFTVNLALMRHGRPFLGVVHAPASGLTFFAQSGCGAWRQKNQDAPRPICTRPASLNRLTVVASRDHSGPAVKRLLEKLPGPEITSIGSSLKFCLVAEGRADLYFRDGPTMEWDTAAAQCILEAAGGQVLDLRGSVLQYRKPGLKNSAFVALGDPVLPWHLLAPAADDRAAFLNFFAELCCELDNNH
jgi:3'(2'), 5'-bisphosphate nucleotidase